MSCATWSSTWPTGSRATPTSSNSALAHWMSKERLGGKPVVLRRGLQLR